MEFDAFLSYNSNEQTLVRELRDRLVKRGLRIWFDEDNLIPGERLLEALEAGIKSSSSALVCFGPSGCGPWQNEEIEGVLHHAAERGMLVIPVLLPGASHNPEMPLFLKTRRRVDLRNDTDELAINQIVVAIKSLQPKPPIVPTPPRPDPPLPVATYIERQCDKVGKREISKPGCVALTLRGPGEIGKSSLLARLEATAEAAGKRVVHIDFQGDFNNEDFEKVDRLYRSFMSLISKRLDIEDHTKDPNVWIGATINSTATDYLTTQILPNIHAPLVLAMDEVDRIYFSPLKEGERDDFFGMLRSWHDQSDTFAVGMILVICTEPAALITDPNQSPFNVGIPINLQDFDLDQVRRLNRLYDDPLSLSELERLQDLVGGHPSLIHKAIHVVATGQQCADQLFSNALRTDDQGPFAQALGHYERILCNNISLIEWLRRVIKHGIRPPADQYYRLLWLGLIRETATGAKARNRLYEEFFTERP